MICHSPSVEAPPQTEGSSAGRKRIYMCAILRRLKCTLCLHVNIRVYYLFIPEQQYNALL